MAIVLQVFGAVFLLILVFVVVLVLKVRAKIRGFVKTIEGLAKTMAPSRIHLTPLAAPGWADADAIHPLTGPLPSLGFREAGHFLAEEAGGLELEAWVNPETCVTAVVHEHPGAGVWLDFDTRYQDGTRFTCSNSTRPVAPEHAPGRDLRRFPGLDTRALYERFLADRPGKAANPVSAETFAQVFEQDHAEGQDWRAGLGGMSEAQARTIAALSDQGYGEKILAATREMAGRRAAEDLNERLRNRFLDETRMSASEWEKVRDRVVLVHDRMGSEDLEALIAPLRDGGPGPAPGPDADESPRRAFSWLNEALPPARRLTKLGTVSEPVGADVYVWPEG